MTATIHERSSVDYDLEIHVPAEELAPRLQEALRTQRKKMNLKGFRPGRAPAQMVKKIYGSEIALNLAQEVIQEAWRDEIAEKDELDVIGAPKLEKLDFDFDTDLNATLRFGVRPKIELADKYERTVRRLVREVSEEDVDEEIERRRLRAAEVVETDEPAEETSIVVADMHEVDKASGSPIIGKRQEDAEIDLTDERLRAEMRDAIIGRKPGDTVHVELPHQHDEDEGHDHDDHTDRIMLTIKTVRRRELPEIDEAFIADQTAGQKSTTEEYREMIRAEIERATRRVGEDFMRDEIIEALLSEIDVPVPEALIETVLDDMEQDLARQFGGDIPEGLDRQGFRDERREAATNTARWILIEQQFAEDAGIEVGEADLEEEYERLAESGPGSADMVRSFVESQPQMRQNLSERIRSRRIFEKLSERFEVVDVTADELRRQQEIAA